jgi:hypothetical protein
VTDKPKNAQPRPSKDQRTEWFESPVTEYFFWLVAELKKKTREQLADQGYDTESAAQLMANRGNLWGVYNAYDAIEEVFESQSFEQIEEQEDAEHVGDLSPGRSGTH